MQAFPEQATDAARVVAPGQPGHALECARRQSTLHTPKAWRVNGGARRARMHVN
jgi:hypothetical protein